MSDWNLLYKELTGTHDYIKPNTSVTQKQIAEVEKVLNCKLPTDLKELLIEINGDNWLVFSTEQIIKTRRGYNANQAFNNLDISICTYNNYNDCIAGIAG